MDPRNFLQLITKYALKDILIWANSGRRLPIVSGPNIHELSKKVIELMGEHAPGGENTLTKIIDIVKSHNRLDYVKHKSTRICPEDIRMSMDAWYECISQSTTADFKLPLYFTDMPASRKALVLLLKGKGTQRLSLIFSELLHDPLFPYRSLQDIPDLVLLEWCATHSYPHLLDKLKVNDPCVATTQENIKTRVERLLHAPVVWVPEDPAVESSAEDNTKSNDGKNSLFMDDDDMEDATKTSFKDDTERIDSKNSLFVDNDDMEDAVENSVEDDTESVDSKSSLFMDDDDMEDATTQASDTADEYLQHCAHCLDNGEANCEVDAGLRQPGQVCAQCETLGKPCEDRLARERDASLASETFERDYHQRQKYDGHVRERAAENDRLRELSHHRVFAARQHLYLLLLDEFSGRHGYLLKASTLCLPKKKPIESEILALIESISEPRDSPSLAKERAALLSTSTSSKSATAVDNKIGQFNEDDEMEDEDVSTVMNAIDVLIRSSEAAKKSR